MLIQSSDVFLLRETFPSILHINDCHSGTSAIVYNRYNFRYYKFCDYSFFVTNLLHINFVNINLVMHKFDYV
jgi:hypothetical protein